MTSLNISLPESMKKFIEEQVERGGYGTISEYVRGLVRADQERAEARRFEQLVLEGLDSGPSREMTDSEWARLRQLAGDRRQKRKRA